MKYLVLMAAEERDWAGDAGGAAAVMDAHGRSTRRCGARDDGRRRGARAVGGGGARCATSTAEPVVTEGPYAETVEQLGGFYLIEADSIDDGARPGAGCSPSATPSRSGR